MPDPRTDIIVYISNPCTEDWGIMTPVERGRFCESCQKSVIDFSVMTNDEIFLILSGANKKNELCGRFFPEQLATNFTQPTVNEPAASRKIFQKLIAGSAFLLQLLASELKAQPKTKPAYIKEAASSKEKSAVIKGQLFDFETQTPISGIKIFFKKDSLQAELFSVTDKNGHFSIRVPKEAVVGGLLTAAFQNDGTCMIPDEVIGTNYQDIVLYRLPLHKLDKVFIKATKPSVQEEHRIQGGIGWHDYRDLEIQPIPGAKENFWQRLTSVFRKKQRPGS